MNHWVYILHFDVALHHAQHYVGMTSNLVERLKLHHSGGAARLTQVLQELGLTWVIGTAAMVDSKEKAAEIERRLKRSKKKSRLYCEICAGAECRRIKGAVIFDHHILSQIDDLKPFLRRIEK